MTNPAMKNPAMKKAMNKRALFSGLGLLAVAGVVLLVVQLASLAPNLRLDLTEDSLYTLADGTKSMLKDMETPVKVELYYSAELARSVPQIDNYAQRVQALLREYARLSGGKLELVVTDPEPFSEDEDRAGEHGLVSVPIVPGGPEMFLGLTVTGASGKPEVIPFFRPDREETLEYDLSQIVWKASRKTAPKIALYAGLDVQGGFDVMTRQPTDPWASVAQIEQLYGVEPLAPDFKVISDDTRLLVLIHPVGLGELSLRAIDRYARAGGAVLVFVDPNAAQAGAGMFGTGATPVSDLAPLFAAWGIEYDPAQVLLDAQLAVPVSSDENGRPQPHVGIQQFGPAELPGDDVVTARLERLITASAGVLRHKAGATSTFQPLLLSSDQAMLVPAARFTALTDHTELYDGFQPTGERYVVAARIGGMLPAAFPPAAAGEPAADATVTPKPASIVVVADTDLLSDRLWVRVQEFMGERVAQPFADNGDFAVNAVDSLMGSAALMDIRGRGRYERPFDVVDRLERDAQMDLQSKQGELEARLTETEAKLQEMQARKQQDAKAFELDQAQVAEMQRFLDEKLKVRKELRDVQHQLGSDIEQLGSVLKVVNILVAPLLLVLLAFGVAWWKLRRR